MSHVLKEAYGTYTMGHVADNVYNPFTARFAVCVIISLVRFAVCVIIYSVIIYKFLGVS